MNSDFYLKQALELLQKIDDMQTLSGAGYFWVQQNKYWKWQEAKDALIEACKAGGVALS